MNTANARTAEVDQAIIGASVKVGDGLAVLVGRRARVAERMDLAWVVIGVRRRDLFVAGHLRRSILRGRWKRCDKRALAGAPEIGDRRPRAREEVRCVRHHVGHVVDPRRLFLFVATITNHNHEKTCESRHA